MKAGAVAAIAVLAALAGVILGRWFVDPAEPISVDTREELAGIRAVNSRLDELASRLPASTLSAASPNPARSEDSAPRLPSSVGQDARDFEAVAGELKALRSEIARLGDEVAKLQGRDGADSQAPRLRETYTKAREADWAVLQEYGRRWLDPTLSSAARGEVVYLSEPEMLAKFGRPTSMSNQSPSGTLWKYSRDSAQQREGDVFTVKFNLSTGGFVTEAWDVEVVSSSK